MYSYKISLVLYDKTQDSIVVTLYGKLIYYWFQIYFKSKRNLKKIQKVPFYPVYEKCI